MAGDRRQDEERVDDAHDRRLDEHRQAAGERRRALVAVELHRLALQALGVLRCRCCRARELRRETGAGLLRLGLRDADGDERGAHEQGDEHDGRRGARDADDGFEEAGEGHEHGVRAVEEAGDGREGVEVHEVFLAVEG